MCYKDLYAMYEQETPRKANKILKESRITAS